jgi:hypothetical protein
MLNQEAIHKVNFFPVIQKGGSTEQADDFPPAPVRYIDLSVFISVFLIMFIAPLRRRGRYFQT